MLQMESGSILIRFTERQKLCFPERPGVESNPCGVPASVNPLTTLPVQLHPKRHAVADDGKREPDCVFA
jgi:hypothetical protein